MICPYCNNLEITPYSGKGRPPTTCGRRKCINKRSYQSYHKYLTGHPKSKDTKRDDKIKAMAKRIDFNGDPNMENAIYC
jgi:hypothetical protein